MATFKATVRNQRKDGFYKVYIMCTHRTQPTYISTDKMVNNAGLAKDKKTIIDPYVREYCDRRILKFVEKLNKVDISRWNVQQVVDYLLLEDSDVCFSDFARKHIDEMVNTGHERNARNYELALQHLERFAGTNKLMCSRLTSVFVNAWLDTLAHTHRAKEMYPVCMRQVFKAAVREFNDYDNDIIRIKTNPWVKVKIPAADRTAKIAISPEDCRTFFSAPLPETKMKDPIPEIGRDVAKMILCLAGINTVDLYEMKKENYQHGCFCYCRAKTKAARRDSAYIEMRVEPIIMPLLEKYKAADDDPYMFSFHKRFASSDSFCAAVNVGIKNLCKSMGMGKEQWYHAYTFRHTWGTVAQNDCGANIAEVGFAMNHSHGHTVTRGYIKIDFSPAWELNAKVIDFIFFSTAQSKQGKARGFEERREDCFRIRAKYMVYGRAYFRGECLAEVSDIGFNNKEEVISKLASLLPDSIPDKCAVQFRIKNVDTDCEMVYERTKGKGF